MKFNSLTRTIRYSFLVLALTAHTTMRPVLDSNEQRVIVIFKEFIDPSRNPNKKFQVYAKEITELLRHQSKYAPVVRTLETLVHERCDSPIKFYMKFKNHADLLPQEVREMFKATSSQRKEELIRIFKNRLKY